MAAGAVEAGDIVLYESNEESNDHSSVCEPWRIDPNNGSQLNRENKDVERRNNCHPTSQSCFFKKPPGYWIHLSVHPDETPGADHIKRLRPEQGNDGDKKHAKFKKCHYL
jgi:hypothetical protein